MSVIAHWIEQQGIKTVVIGLVKLHLEKIKPPRALSVSFELGRPLGGPENSEFQLEVLTSALRLIETQTEPAIVDFEKDDPRAEPDPKWAAPAIATADTISNEVIALKPFYQAQCVNKSRTSVGVSKIPIVDAAALLDSAIAGETLTSSREDISPVLMLRLAIDDLKAYYIEAALGKGSPCSRQVYDWFWLESLLGQQIRELRKRYMQSDDEKLAKLGEKFCVPHRWRD